MRPIYITAILLASTFTLGAAFPVKTSPENKLVPTISDKPTVTLDSQDYKAKDFSNLLGMNGFSDSLLKMHFKLYQGYVKNTNFLRDKLRELENSGKERTPDYAGLKRMFGWEFDGMRLHEYYFENLGGTGESDKKSKLYQALVKQYGSYENWLKSFKATGLLRGIGWTILYQDPHSGNLMNVWINEHDVGHLSGSKPLLVMDVWEHAYITEYGIDRAAYIDAFLKNVNWNVVQQRYSGE